jgi:hypothetical protein
MSRYSRRRKYCRFTAEGIEEIDYKDLGLLKQNHRDQGALPAAVVHGGQAGTLPGIAAVHRSSLIKRHPGRLSCSR